MCKLLSYLEESSTNCNACCHVFRKGQQCMTLHMCESVVSGIETMQVNSQLKDSTRTTQELSSLSWAPARGRSAKPQPLHPSTAATVVEAAHIAKSRTMMITRSARMMLSRALVRVPSIGLMLQRGMATNAAKQLTWGNGAVAQPAAIAAPLRLGHDVADHYETRVGEAMMSPRVRTYYTYCLACQRKRRTERRDASNAR